MVFFNLTGRRLQPFFQKASWFFDTPVCKPEPGFATTAIQSLCREGDIAGARKLFDEMPEKNVFSFSTMIYGYSSNGFFVDSLHLFSNMQDLQIHPNSYTFVALLLASAGLRNSKIGESIHGRVIKNGLEFDAFVSTALLNSYSKCGSVADAYRLFCASDRPSLAHWNAMIAGFVLDHLFEEALLLFERLKLSGAMPNCITMMSVTQGCLGHGSLRLSESVHGYIVKAGFESDLSLMNSVLDMYLSFGCLDIAGGFFAKMEAKDVISWTNMMGFMLDIAHPVDALQLFSQMRDSRIDVDVVAMMIVTSACTILGDLTKGRNVVSCNAMISSFGINGRAEEALSLFQEMENFGEKPDSITFVNALNTCVHSGMVDEGLKYI
ncbi:hypothetical protein HPP92_012935 [Vanilla planifolia]|uniref:Pentatricopeptide repeat-containing protein n=1 Tax=Vanilla planifolia TaxID=51239 RepID=A0A835UUC5_VANPL|nr:hypothetical protein HPP92_012935 [Vanilla planifolia]